MFGGIKSYLYIGLAIAVVALATMGFRWFTGIQAENSNLKDAVAEHVIQKAALESESKNKDIVITAYETAMETQAIALTLVNDQFNVIREEKNKQTRVLEGGRLARLAAERAQKIEELSNRATQDRFNEFEAIINEDF